MLIMLTYITSIWMNTGDLDYKFTCRVNPLKTIMCMQMKTNKINECAFIWGDSGTEP